MKAPSEEQLFAAADLRAGGFRWEFVAEKMNRSVETVRRWPMRFAERWQDALQRAEIRHAVDNDAEACVILRRAILTSNDIKLQVQAARALIALRLGLGRIEVQNRKHAPGQPIDKALILAELLESYSHEDLAELARAGMERLARRDAGVTGDTPTSAA